MRATSNGGVGGLLTRGAIISGPRERCCWGRSELARAEVRSFAALPTLPGAGASAAVKVAANDDSISRK